MKLGWKSGLTISEEQTIDLGVNFSKYIEKGDLIALKGDLGSGKTTFTKGILKGLNYSGKVTSPTYTMINEYDCLQKVIHIDCYKEKKIGIWLSLGLNDYIDDHNNIIIIEWPEILEEILPSDLINISFKHINDNQREICLL